MTTLGKYLLLWWKLTENSFLVSLTNRFNAILFFIGKILRFGFFIVFLLALFTRTEFLAHYSVAQVVFFFLTFNFIDTVAYRFRPMVVSGDFDLVLVKPINPLFRALAGGADPLDLFMLIPYIGALIYVATRLGTVSFLSLSLYVLLLINGFLIATGFHILVLALAIMTTEIDHTIMIYRDVTSMGRVPVDIYREPLRSMLTFVIPVGVMMTFPAKAFLGFLSPVAIVVALILGMLFLLLCLRIWRYSLSLYASASS
ncbi:ABC-2 family transporter protein [Candidatus Gottesmanbacteria bacterium]|nr:ABC-2 family transporter protein [Candidatus Gottesmanbacteria bacterium]